MLRDLGCTWVLVGHSERRSLHAETDEIVVVKAGRALDDAPMARRLLRRAD